jgi:hypothetical protein
MSLVGTFVKCTDGNWYQGLVYRAQDNTWFICFDDDDPPELVARETCKLTPRQICEKLGLQVKAYNKGSHSDRSFNGRFRPAKSVFLDVVCNKPFPAPSRWDQYDRAFQGHPHQEGVYYGD